MKCAEVMFGSVFFNLKVIGDGVASSLVAQEHLVWWLFKVEVLHCNIPQTANCYSLLMHENCLTSIIEPAPSVRRCV